MKKAILIGLILLGIVLSGCVQQSTCGNGVADPDETCSNCESDVSCDTGFCVEEECVLSMDISTAQSANYWMEKTPLGIKDWKVNFSGDPDFCYLKLKIINNSQKNINLRKVILNAVHPWDLEENTFKSWTVEKTLEPGQVEKIFFREYDFAGETMGACVICSAQSKYILKPTFVFTIENGTEEVDYIEFPVVGVC